MGIKKKIYLVIFFLRFGNEKEKLNILKLDFVNISNKMMIFYFFFDVFICLFFRRNYFLVIIGFILDVKLFL